MQASKEVAEDIVLANVALRVGQAIWFLLTYPLRLLLRVPEAS